jgi:hypothetical protein
VDVKNEQISQTVELKGKIDSFTSVANFVVWGQICDASDITSVGHGTQIGNVLKVTELEIDD